MFHTKCYQNRIINEDLKKKIGEGGKGRGHKILFFSENLDYFRILKILRAL